MSPPVGREPADTRTPERGHRLLAHTADWGLESWGPTRAACLEEAVMALVSCFADTSNPSAPVPIPVTFGSAPDADLLVTVLEEVLYLVDVLGVVPLTVEFVDGDDGGITGTFDVVAVESVDAIGPAPKGVSRQVAIGRDRTVWRCRALVDV